MALGFQFGAFQSVGFQDEPGGAPAPAVVAVAGGVKRRPVVVRLRDVENRKQFGDYLKEQLRLQHGDLMSEIVAPVPVSAKPNFTVSAEDVAKAMELEQAENTRKRIIAANNAIIASILASYDDES